jgi:hypothetical protein
MRFVVVVWGDRRRSTHFFFGWFVCLFVCLLVIDGCGCGWLQSVGGDVVPRGGSGSFVVVDRVVLYVCVCVVVRMLGGGMGWRFRSLFSFPDFLF